MMQCFRVCPSSNKSVDCVGILNILLEESGSSGRQDEDATSKEGSQITVAFKAQRFGGYPILDFRQLGRFARGIVEMSMQPQNAGFKEMEVYDTSRLETGWRYAKYKVEA